MGVAIAPALSGKPVRQIRFRSGTGTAFTILRSFPLPILFRYNKRQGCDMPYKLFRDISCNPERAHMRKHIKAAM